MLTKEYTDMQYFAETNVNDNSMIPIICNTVMYSQRTRPLALLSAVWCDMHIGAGSLRGQIHILPASRVSAMSRHVKPSYPAQCTISIDLF